ncbi:MAG: hypothetical protein U1E73_08460 [Planctomycetota bacterium]
MFAGRVTSVLLFAVLSVPAVCQEKPVHPAHPQAADEAKPKSFVVADIAGTMSVMTKDDFAAAEKTAADEYAAAAAQFEKDKKAALDAKKPFDQKPPMKAHVVAHGNFPTLAAAEEALKKMREEHDKAKKAKEGATDHAHPAEPPKKKK